MLLTILAKRWRVVAETRPALVRLYAAPSVFDKMVQFTILDTTGRRHVVRGLEGQSIIDVLSAHIDVFGEDALCLGPQGRDQYEAHIKLPNELLDVIPEPKGEESDWLHDIADGKGLDKHSRLASKVVLTPELDGSLIALGAVAPWKTL